MFQSVKQHLKEGRNPLLFFLDLKNKTKAKISEAKQIAFDKG
jgi:hypothetical protein